MRQDQAWVLLQKPHDDAFENSERLQEISKQLQPLLETSPSASHQQEREPMNPSAVQPTAFERLVTDYHRLDEQLELLLAEFAHPESFEQGNTLDF